ncbi:Galactose-binding domain-like, partial [Trinorchestia longiramus]
FSSGHELCITSSVFSTDWFPGIPENSQSATATYEVCYSSWASSENIVVETMATTSSGPYNSQRAKELAIDGYYCHAPGYEARRFDGQIRANNFLQLDLGSLVVVREIRLALRRNPETFDSVTIRFGPSSSPASNEIIAQSPKADPTGGLDIFLDPPVEGRYLYFKQAPRFYFTIGEIQVLP